MDMIGRIRRLRSRKNKSEREIARASRGCRATRLPSGCTARLLVRRCTGAALSPTS